MLHAVTMHITSIILLVQPVILQSLAVIAVRIHPLALHACKLTISTPHLKSAFPVLKIARNASTAMSAIHVRSAITKINNSNVKSAVQCVSNAMIVPIANNAKKDTT